MNNSSLPNRRDVLKTGAIAATFPFASRVSWAAGSPMQKLQYAAVAVDGRGALRSQEGDQVRHLLGAGGPSDGNAAKGVEIGAGFAAAAFSGEQNADGMRMGNDGVRFLSNHNGGVAGGISTGQDVVVRLAIKPTSSILSATKSVTRDGEEVDVRTIGRHDPCVGIRAVPVAEAMLACVLADAKLRHRGQVG